jgi:ketosteroid isomerase-like protein
VAAGSQIEANKSILRRALASYARGDLAPVFAVLDENVVWSSNALADHYRFGGRREGHAGVREALSMIAADYEIARYDVIEMVGEGDVVWVASNVAVFDRKRRRTLTFPIINRWELRDGKIVSCSEFFDTAAVLQQQGRIGSETLRETRA